MENYWDYLADKFERPENLSIMKQLLHATACGKIRSTYPNISDGHALAKHYVKRCMFLA